VAVTLAPTDLEVLLGLAATERCCVGDLDEDPDEPLEAMAARKAIVAKFIALRSREPEGQERIRSIDGRLPVFSLHAGRWRGATAPDKVNAVVWLLGGSVHRDGDHSDSYPHFERLNSRDRLFPADADYERLFERRNAQAIPLMLSRVAATLVAARETPGQTQTVLLASGLTVGVLVDREPPGEMDETVEQIWLAVSSQGLTPGWLGLIQGALTPGPEKEPWTFVKDFPGRGPDHRELRFHCWHEVNE
jgi:hypothetical protein